MQTINCETDSIRLVMKCPPTTTFSRVALVQGRCAIELPLPSAAPSGNPDNPPPEPVPVGEFTVGPLPQDVKDGVYELQVQTSCGCYYAPLHVSRCQSPSLPGTHTPTDPSAGEPPTPECTPLPDPPPADP